MYSICKTTHPATGIEHALTCNFFNQSEKSLVVAGANIIRVLRLIPDIEPNKKKPKNLSMHFLTSHNIFKTGNECGFLTLDVAP